jgi:hypothetical protein
MFEKISFRNKSLCNYVVVFFKYITAYIYFLRNACLCRLYLMNIYWTFLSYFNYRLKSAPYVATLQTYKGGGYVINFERSYRRTVRNLTRLRQEDWLDLRTRAVILEFTVYNPNSNLFASAVMTTEFPAFGAAMARSEFKVQCLEYYSNFSKRSMLETSILPLWIEWFLLLLYLYRLLPFHTNNIRTRIKKSNHNNNFLDNIPYYKIR